MDFGGTLPLSGVSYKFIIQNKKISLSTRINTFLTFNSRQLKTIIMKNVKIFFSVLTLAFLTNLNVAKQIFLGFFAVRRSPHHFVARQNMNRSR